ncbi:MAG: hypothetical protein Q9170_000049 [Blastenia crenularia]
MAGTQHFRSPSEGSSDASHTYFTPSGTLLAPSGTTFDISTGTDPDGLDDPSIGLVSSGGDWPMDVDFDLLPGIIPAFERSTAGANGAPNFEQDLARPAIAGSVLIDALGQQPNEVLLTLEDVAGNDRNTGLHLLVPSVTSGAWNETHYHDQSQRMHDHVAAFNQAYHHIPVSQHQLPTTYLTDETPRYVLGPVDGRAGPWSAWIMRDRTDRSHFVSELVYEPAMEVATADPDTQSSGCREGLSGELDSHVHLEEDLCLDDAASMNLDQFLPPDIVGSPPNGANTQIRHSLEKPGNSVIGGRRNGPLNAQSRRNARTTRQKVAMFKSLGPPASLARQHEPEKLRAFAAKRVHRWLDNHMTVYLTWGYFRPIKCDVTEIVSNGPSLLLQNQYRLNLATDQYELVQVPSPPLGMMLMLVKEWRSKLNQYLEDLLQTSFRRFPEVCFRGEACRVERDFLLPIFEYHEASTGKVSRMEA